MASKIYYKTEGLKFKKQDSATSTICIDSSGNIGIGTETPQYKLDINGELEFSASLNIRGNIILNTNNTISSTTDTITLNTNETQINGDLSLSSNKQLMFGTNKNISSLSDNNLTITADTTKLLGNLFITGSNIYFDSTTGPKITYSSTSPQITISCTNLTTTGDITINGNLKLLGTTVLNTEVDHFTTKDKDIVLADGITSNTGANEGGITLKGTTDKKITYESSGNSWKSNIDFKVGSNITLDESSGIITATSLTPGTFTISDSTITNTSDISFNDKNVKVDNFQGAIAINSNKIGIPQGIIVAVNSKTYADYYNGKGWKICNGNNNMNTQHIRNTKVFKNINTRNETTEG